MAVSPNHGDHLTVFCVCIRSVLECESVMKGLYGMLGLEYRDEDSEEEGGGEPLDVIHLTDEEEDRQENSVFNGDDDDDDIVVIDLGGKRHFNGKSLEILIL